VLGGGWVCHWNSILSNVKAVVPSGEALQNFQADSLSPVGEALQGEALLVGEHELYLRPTTSWHVFSYRRSYDGENAPHRDKIPDPETFLVTLRLRTLVPELLIREKYPEIGNFAP
jgi:hypothetical protein